MPGTQQREEIGRIAELISAIDICMFTTTAENGELMSRPMSNNREVEWDGDSYFFAPTEGRLVSQLKADPTAATTYRAQEGWTFVALAGKGSVDDDPELKKRYWLDELEQWFPNGPDDPGVSLVRFEATSARWWTEDGDGEAHLASTRRSSRSATTPTS